MKILVTGASGFIGRHLVHYLQVKNYEVFKASRFERLGYLRLDINEPIQVSRLLEEFEIETVVNLAWHTSGSDYQSSNVNYQALEWNQALYQIIRASHVQKIISVGSSAEYFERKEHLTPYRDESNIYSQTKSLAHKSFVEMFSDSGKAHIWLRPFQLYGPGQSSQHFIPTLCEHVRGNRVLRVIKPHAIRDWVDVRDVAEAIQTVIEHFSSGEIDVGTARGTSVAEICDYARFNFGLNWVSNSVNLGIDSRNLVAVSISELFEYFMPKRSLFDYLDRVLM